MSRRWPTFVVALAITPLFSVASYPGSRPVIRAKYFGKRGIRSKFPRTCWRRLLFVGVQHSLAFVLLLTKLLFWNSFLLGVVSILMGLPGGHIAAIYSRVRRLPVVVEMARVKFGSASSGASSPVPAILFGIEP